MEKAPELDNTEAQNALKIEESVSNVDDNVSKLEGSVSDVDDRILNAQGHASQLQRSFNWLGALGFGYRFARSFNILLDMR